MKRTSLFLVLLAAAGPAGAQTLRAQIDAMNATMRTASMHRDVDLFLRAAKGHVAKEFTYREGGRVLGFDGMVAGMRQGLGAMEKVTTVDAKVLRLVETGDTATCTTGHVVRGIVRDAKKKAHPFGFAGTSVETYRREKGRWLMVSMVWRDEHTSMDGKPPAMPKLAG